MYTLQVKLTNKGTTLVVSINGELDHHSAEYIRQRLDAEIIKSTTKNIIFDMENVSFMDSSGVGVIMGRYKNIQKLNGKVAIASVNNQIKRIFDMSGILKFIPNYDNIDKAISSL